MSAETFEWLNTMTLIGFTEQRGNAWHYRVEDQGDEPNHYTGAIPVEDVLRRLFNFDVVEQPLSYYFQDRLMTSDRKLMVASDNGDLLGVFKDGYQGHSYQEWLLSQVATLLDDDLGIGSAGLLRNRAQAWVSVEVPETIKTPEGVDFRPNLVAATSFDGSLATTYKRTMGIVVCDNTLAAALDEKGQAVKVKHSRYSKLKLKDARDALAIVHSMADDFAQQVSDLCSQEVNAAAFNRVLDIVLPLPEEQGRSMTMAQNKRDQIINLYRHDERVAPWAGTTFGVIQAFNTWQHHIVTVKGEKSRVQRNYENVVTNVGDNFDRSIYQAVQQAVAA